MPVRHLIYMVQNDTNPPVDFEVVNDDEVCDPHTGAILTPATAYDLTGCTVRFTIKNQLGTITNAAHPICTIVGDPTLGVARYQFVLGDIPKPGRYKCDVQVTGADSRVQTEYTVTDLQVRAENDT